MPESEPQLPRLVSDSRVPVPASSGTWEWHDEKILSDLSDSLYTDVNPQFFDVDAIPDLWARPILFNIAFCDSDHPLHQKILGEWRGMMALIGLSRWRGDPLAIRNVTLSNSADGEAAGEEENASSFTSIAARLSPQKSIDKDTRWENLHVLQYDGETIALSSPLTLISTAETYRAHGVPWWNGQVLRDPLGRYGAGNSMQDELNAQERKALKDWLNDLENRLKDKRQPPVGNPVSSAEDSWEKLLGAIHEFSGDLSGNGLSDRPKPFDVRRNEFGMRGDGLLQQLDAVVDSPDTALQDSQVRLCSDPDLDTEDLPTLLIIGEEIAEQWGERPQDIIVHGVDTLANVENASGSQNTLNRETIEGGEWRRPDDLFSDRLAVIEEQNAFNRAATHSTGSGLGGQVTCALPLTRELLRYLTPEDLADRVRVTKRPNGQEYRVQVDLPLAGPEGNSRDVTFEQIYEPEDVVLKDASPFYEVWPDFRAEDWSEYYTFYSGPGEFYLEAYADSKDVSTERLRHGEVRREIAEMENFPKAVLCYDASGDEYLGFIATIPPEKASATFADTMVVGVDFGTSNTTVYTSDTNGVPEPIRFEDRLISITSEKGLRLTNTTQFFIPAREQGVPFMTFFHHLPTAQDANPGPTVEVPREGHILYSKRREDRASLDSGDVHHNLKWSKSSSDRARTKAFIEQIVLQARAEAKARRVSDVQWRYSYPTSFSQSQKESMDEMWRSLVDTQKLESKSESLSTATYFLDAQNARLADGSICIDIGGKSADLAVWQDGKMLLQTSILLASREILLKTIAAEPAEYQPVFRNDDYDDIVERNTSLQDTITDLEELLVLEGEDFLENLSVLSGESSIARLQQRLALGVSGVFYYAGLLVRHLSESGEFDPGEGLPDIYFGGNGSKVLHWLAEGKFRGIDSPIGGLFEEVLIEATGFDISSVSGSFEVQLTPEDHVKHEVAYGLVSDRNLEVEGGSPVVAGESFRHQENGQSPSSWDDALTAKMLSTGVDIEGSLSHLRRLTDTINEFAEENKELLEPLSDSDENIERARGQVRNLLQDLSGREEQDIDPEALFVLGVKEYLDVIR